MANDTRVDCWSYLWPNDSSSDSTDCWGIAAAIGIEREEFALWNPSLDQNPVSAENATYDYPWSAQVSVSYCIGIARPTPVWDEKPVVIRPPTPRASGEIEGCTYWQKVFEGDDCAGFLPGSLTVADFFQMNPSVGKDCTGLNVGTRYCLSTLEIGMWAPSEDVTSPSPTSTKAPVGSGTPTPIQDGMAPGCTKFYKVISEDGCWAIINADSIALTDFYAWNPALESDCQKLQTDYYVCVGRAPVTSSRSVTPGTPIRTPTPTPTNTRPPPPGATQAGITSNCNKWVLQTSGVYCYDMAAAAGISLDRLYQLNPALNGDCSGLWPSYVYCIGVA